MLETPQPSQYRFAAKALCSSGVSLQVRACCCRKLLHACSLSSFCLVLSLRTYVTLCSSGVSLQAVGTLATWFRSFIDPLRPSSPAQRRAMDGIDPANPAFGGGLVAPIAPDPAALDAAQAAAQAAAMAAAQAAAQGDGNPVSQAAPEPAPVNMQAMQQFMVLMQPFLATISATASAFTAAAANFHAPRAPQNRLKVPSPGTYDGKQKKECGP